MVELWSVRGSESVCVCASVCVPVVFSKQQFDVVELWSVRGVLAPAALHELSQILAVTLRAERGPQVRTLASTHSLYYLWREGEGGREEQLVVGLIYLRVPHTYCYTLIFFSVHLSSLTPHNIVFRPSLPPSNYNSFIIIRHTLSFSDVGIHYL